MTRIRFDGCDLSRPRGTPVVRVYPYDRGVARYDGIADWYDTEFLGDVHDPGREAAVRLTGKGPGRLLDLGCGTGAQTLAFRDAGWDVTGVDVSEDMLRRARIRELNVVRADASKLPFDDASFDAAVSVWTHTDVDDFPAAIGEVARVLRPDGPLVYVGGHPCFVGPHSRFMYAEGVPELHPGYLQEGRYGLEAVGIGSEEGLRAKVGAVHLTLAGFLQSFLDVGLTLERFEELELENRPYPFAVALRWRR
jgi:SAM-dependent methyltransferase